MKKLLGTWLPAICGAGPVIMVIALEQLMLSLSPRMLKPENDLPFQALLFLPYFGALGVSAALFSLYSTTNRQTKEIDRLRKELEALKTERS